MENFLIIGLLAVVILVALGSCLKHFKGQGGCCGGGSYKPRKKKLSKVIATKTFRVEGMHCQHCSNRVTEVINDIPHAAASVNLKKGTVTISFEQEVPEALIRSEIQRVGYSVTETL